jgi:dCMP deaminase
MTRTVHCLDEGLALCGYEGGAVPAEWPEGNVWIALSDWPALPGARAAIEDERGELCRSCDARARGLDPPLTSLRIPRLPWDPFFMLHAHLAATRSTCDRGPELLLDAGRHGVGAVFVRDRRIVAGGYNGSPPNEPHCDWLVCPECEWEESPKWFDGTPGVEAVCPECKTKLEGGHLISDGHCVRTLHAEENAILQCAMDGGTPKGATVYTTASPCWDCSKRLVRVGIARLVYAADYGSRYGLSGDAGRLLRRAGIEVAHLDVRSYLGKEGDDEVRRGRGLLGDEGEGSSGAR